MSASYSVRGLAILVLAASAPGLASAQDFIPAKGEYRCVFCVAFSPDGKRIAAGSDDGSAHIWDAVTGAEVVTLTGHTNSVCGVVFSPDGKRLATGSMDNTVRIWDAQTGEVSLTFKGHTDSVRRLAFSPDGKRLATGSSDKTVKVWDARTGKLFFTTPAQTYGVTGLAFSPDGTLLASAEEGFDKDYKSQPSAIQLWDAKTGKAVRTLEGHMGPISNVAFSPDSKQLASCGNDKAARIWDVAEGTEVRALKGHAGSLTAVSYNSDGTRLATSAIDKKVKIWDPATGKVVRTLEGFPASVNGVAFGADGSRLVTGSGDLGQAGDVRVWKVSGTSTGGTGDKTAQAVTSTRLVESYEDNEVAADRKYKGKMLAVTGPVKKVFRNKTAGTVSVLLAGGEDTPGVECRFDAAKENETEKLEKGREVTVRGRCAGKDGPVVLEECTFGTGGGGGGKTDLPTGWKEYVSREGGFRVAMPGTPKETTEKVETAAGNVTLHSVMLEQKDGGFMIAYGDIPNPNNATDDQRLDGARDGAVSNVKGGKLASEKKIKLGKYPGREMLVEAEGGIHLRARIYLVEDRLYQLLAMGTSKDAVTGADGDTFLGSFQLREKKEVPEK